MENWDNIRKMMAPGLGQTPQVPYHMVTDFEWEDSVGKMRFQDPAVTIMYCSKCGKKMPNIHLMSHEASCQGVKDEMETTWIPPEFS